MILTERDILEFTQRYERFAEYEGWDDRVELAKLLEWMTENPQVLMASGYQEYVAGFASREYRSLVDDGHLDGLSRPIVRDFTGSWIVPSLAMEEHDSSWMGFRLEELLKEQYLSRFKKHNLADLRKEFEAGRISHQDYHDVSSQIAEYGKYQGGEARLSDVTMPSFDEMIRRASKYVDNPLVNKTVWVSPRLWTPTSQDQTKERLQETTSALINAIRTEKKELRDIRWQDFEEIVAEVLRYRGLEVSLVTSRPQGGRDIIARGEVCPGQLTTIAVEVKHRPVVDAPALNTAIQQNSHFPLLMFVTSGRFTSGVVAEASRPKNRYRLSLLDGVAVRDMIATYGLSENRKLP